MTWPLKSSLVDILDSGPDLSDPPEDDWSLLEVLERAAEGLAVRLRHEPGLSRAAAELFCKLETDAPGIFFRSFVWPLARRLAVIMHRIWVDGTEFRWTREVAAT